MTDLWFSWTVWASYSFPGPSGAASASEGSSDCDGADLCKWHVERVVHRDLRNAGFAVPGRRNIISSLQMGLGLPDLSSESDHLRCCSFWHLVNFVWQPLLRYIERLAAGETPSWTSELAVHDAALQLEMEGTVIAATEHLSMDDWLNFIAETIERLVGVKVPEPLLSKVASGTACWIHLEYECIYIYI